MKVHSLKTHSEPFIAVRQGTKSFEIRKDDRGFEVGDLIVLLEYEPSGDRFTGEALLGHVTYKATGWGLPDGYCVLQLGMLSEVGPFTKRGRR